MSFSLNKLDVVFFQRNTSNTAYEQINISGSSAIFYLDENGILQAENISKVLRDGATTKASLQSLNRNYIVGDTIYAVDTVTVGIPNRLAKYLAIPNHPFSYKIVDTDTNTNDTSLGISIGKASYDKSVNATLDISGTVIITGSLIVTKGINFPSSSASSSISSVSSSYSSTSTSSSYALTASYISGSLRGTVESASYSLSSSYAKSSLSASYCESGSYFSYFFYNVTQSITYVSSASWASSSLSSSYSLTASYISGSILGLVPSSSYSLSSSYALTASYVSGSLRGTVESASYALSSSYSLYSLSSSNCLTASYISGTLDINGSSGYYPKYNENTLSFTSSIFENENGIYINVPLFTTASWAVSASWAPSSEIPNTVSSSWASSSLSSSYSLTASYISGSILGLVPSSSYALSASWAPSSDIPVLGSASWASSSLSSSYSLTASYISGSILGLVLSASYALSASWAPSSDISFSNSASWASSSLSASYAPFVQVYQLNTISSSWASSSLSSSYALKAFDLDKTTYNIYVLYASSSKWSISASWASSSLSASYALKALDLDRTVYNISVTYASSSRWSVSASWASSSLSSSYSLKSFDLDKTAYNISVLQSSQSKWAVSASWASSSISASYSPQSLSSSYCLSGSHFDYIYYNVTQSFTYVSSASWASSSLSASYAPWEPNASASIVIQLGNKQNSLSGIDNYVPHWSSNTLTSASSIIDYTDKTVSIMSNKGSASVYAVDIIPTSSINVHVVRMGIAGITNGFTIQQPTAGNLIYAFNGGKVGINTNNPAGILDVDAGDSETDTLNIRCSPSVAGQGGSLYHQASTYAFQHLAQGTADADSCYFTTNLVPRSTPNTKTTPYLFTLRGNGNVGMGLISPTSRFHIYTDTNGTEWINIHNNSTGSGARTGMIIQNDQQTGLYLEKYSSNFSVPSVADCGMIYVNGYTSSLLLGTVGTERLRITPSGYIGIGTTNPIEQLTVNGAIVTNDNIGFYETAESSSRFTISKTTSDLLVLRSIVSTSSYVAISPPNINIGDPPVRESVLSLRRGVDLNNTGSIEYIDFYNTLSGSIENQFGIRLQKRGTGNYRDFVIDRWDGTSQINKNVLFVISASNRNIGIGTKPEDAFKLQSSGSIGPSNDNVFDLGSSTRRWRNIYGTSSFATTASYVFNAITGTGTDNYIPKWSSNTLTGTSQIYDTGTLVGIGTTSPENLDGWANVFGCYSNLMYRFILDTSTVRSVFASHYLGYYGGTAGGYLGTETNHPLHLLTNNTVKLTISASNVGIGITSPSDALTVAGNIKVNAAGNVIRTNYLQDQTGVYNALTLTTPNIIISPNTSGKVGVGNASPAQYVDIVKSQDASTWCQIANYSTGSGARTGFVVISDQSSGLYLEKYSSQYSVSDVRDCGMIFVNGYTASLILGTLGTERMRITPDGNVGIGTTNPSLATLQVQGNVWAISYTGSILGTSSYAVNLSKTAYNISVLQASQSRWATSSSYASRSLSSSYAPWEPRASSSIVVQLAGKQNLLSGTDYYVPHFLGNDLVNGSIIDYTDKSVAIMTNKGSASVYAVDVVPTASAGVHIARFGINGISNGFTIQQGTSGVLTHSFTSGRVGIVTSNPQAELHVNGQISASGNITSHVKLQARSDQPGVILWETDTSNLNRQIDVTSGVFRILKVNDAYDTFSSQLVIDSNGNVGIGTDTPQARLHSYALTSSNPYPLLIQTDAGYINIGVANTGYSHILTDRPAFYVGSNIHISGTIAPYGNNYFDLGTSTWYWRYGYISNLFSNTITANSFIGTSSWANNVISASYATNAGTSLNVINPNPGTGTDNYVPKWSSNTLTGTSLIYDNGSGVGIGTTNISGKLIVNIGGGGCNIVNNTLSSSHSNPTNWSYGGLNIMDPTGDIYRWMHLAIGGTGRYAENASVGRIGFHQLNTNAALSESCGAMIGAFADNSTITSKGMHMGFYTRASTAGSVLPTERLRITNTGNIGIGTTSPENSAGWSAVMGCYNSLMFRTIVSSDTVRSVHAAHYAGYYSGLIGSYIGTETNNALHLIHNSAVRVILTGSYVGIGGTVSPSATLYVDIGSGGSSGNTVLNINKQATTYLNVRGDGRVGIGAAPSSNGFIQITSPDASTPHFSLTNGVTNGNASNTYTFRGWWGAYFNSPGFNGGTSGEYYIQVYS